MILMRRGQGILEYVFMIGIAAAVIIAMGVYVKRGFQGSLRGAAEQIGAGQYSTNNTTANKRVTKNVSSTSVSTSISTTVYGNGGAESQKMQDNRAEQEQLRVQLAALNAEKLANRGTNSNPSINQAATAAGDAITKISDAGIANIITAAQRAQTLDSIDNSIGQVNGALTQLQAAYTKTENSRNTLRDADYGCDGMPASVVQDIADLEEAMRDNLEHQGELRGALADLAVARQNAVDAMDSGATNVPAITPVVTPVDTPRTLEQIQTEIDAINTRLGVLAADYANLSVDWVSRVIVPDQTTGNSSNIETGTQTTDSLTDESLGRLGNDTWR